MSALPEAVYAALSSDVYHSNKLDQWIDLPDINKSFEISLNPANLRPLTPALLAMGFVGPTSDGFYYTPRGFGVRLVKDGSLVWLCDLYNGWPQALIRNVSAVICWAATPPVNPMS